MDLQEQDPTWRWTNRNDLVYGIEMSKDFWKTGNSHYQESGNWIPVPTEQEFADRQQSGALAGVPRLDVEILQNVNLRLQSSKGGFAHQAGNWFNNMANGWR